MKMNIQKLLRENWGFLLFILLMAASRSSVADWYVVPTGSMQPTIVEGDRIFVDKMAYRLDIPFTDIALMETGSPQRGDIVVFVSEKADNRLVKRVIGLPGDKVAMRGNRVFLNGKVLEYKVSPDSFQATENLDSLVHKVQFLPGLGTADNFAPVVVPEGHYLVLGDNRNNSVDSRYYGFVPEAELQGKATKVLVSLDPEDYYLPRTERTWIPLI